MFTKLLEIHCVAHMVLVGILERKRPLGRPGRRWKDDIKMDLQEAGCGGIDWIDLLIAKDGGHL